LGGKEQDAALRHNLGLRSAHIIFMFVSAEAGLLFSLVWPDPCSFFGGHKACIAIFAAAIFLVAFAQQGLGFRIDLYAVSHPAKGPAGG
jgi:hypothetical protein